MAHVEKTFPNFYRDSISLMQLSARIETLDGVRHATAVMATQANIDLLKEAKLITSDLAPRPNDLLVVIDGGDDASVSAALEEAEKALQSTAQTGGERKGGPVSLRASSLEMALEDEPNANFALISTPGEYAAAEAEKALRLGLNTMVFSANVALADEIALKHHAHDSGLLMMGPDCGTSIVNGIPLGFANAVKRGPVGLIGSSGTGLQEVSTLLDRADIGISQVLGCGARDLIKDVGGLSMLQGLAALSEDAATNVIGLVAKHPDQAVARQVAEKAGRIGKPIVLAFLGLNLRDLDGGTISVADTLDDAASKIAAQVNGQKSTKTGDRDSQWAAIADEKAHHLRGQQRYLRALYSGGTFCYEAQVVVASKIGPIWSNTPVETAQPLTDVWKSREHTLIDLGDEIFTRGRPHPMIDLRLRLERLRQEFADPETAVILLDVVLGYGAHADPATEIAKAVLAARADRSPQNGDVIVVASLCGTQADPQNRRRQEDILRNAGLLLAPSNAAAARLAARIVSACANGSTHP